MKALDEIKQMMAAGDTAKAAEALKELLAKEPDNLQAKMLYGTCCQLLGDAETFRRIHDELAPVMEKQEKVTPQSETVSLWKKYRVTWENLIVGAMVLGAVVVGSAYFWKTVRDQYELAGRVMCGKYHGPEYYELRKESASSRAKDAGNYKQQKDINGSILLDTNIK